MPGSFPASTIVFDVMLVTTWRTAASSGALERLRSRPRSMWIAIQVVPSSLRPRASVYVSWYQQKLMIILLPRHLPHRLKFCGHSDLL
jgi:hypothetical protein